MILKHIYRLILNLFPFLFLISFYFTTFAPRKNGVNNSTFANVGVMELKELWSYDITTMSNYYCLNS